MVPTVLPGDHEHLNLDGVHQALLTSRSNAIRFVDVKRRVISGSWKLICARPPWEYIHNKEIARLLVDVLGDDDHKIYTKIHEKNMVHRTDTYDTYLKLFRIVPSQCAWGTLKATDDATLPGALCGSQHRAVAGQWTLETHDETIATTVTRHVGRDPLVAEDAEKHLWCAESAGKERDQGNNAGVFAGATLPERQLAMRHRIPRRDTLPGAQQRDAGAQVTWPGTNRLMACVAVRRCAGAGALPQQRLSHRALQAAHVRVLTCRGAASGVQETLDPECCRGRMLGFPPVWSGAPGDGVHMSDVLERFPDHIGVMGCCQEGMCGFQSVWGVANGAVEPACTHQRLGTQNAFFCAQKWSKIPYPASVPGAKESLENICAVLARDLHERRPDWTAHCESTRREMALVKVAVAGYWSGGKTH
ncbi:hypothetical protein K438DRAFT_1934884 [Mycena galopus ATCC 62051]|nr:hypothetical protein K438DRAFT_1934884 [Mycena galopus ATCC 62051]